MPIAAAPALPTSTDAGKWTYAVPILGYRSPVRVSGTLDERINAIADLQRTHVRRSQLLAAGISSAQIERRARRRRLRIVHRGVYTTAAPGAIEYGAETAALLAVRDGALLALEVAGALWDMHRRTGDHIDVMVVGGAAGRGLRGVAAHRTTELGSGDARIRRGLPVTSPARTLLDLAPLLQLRQIEQALDQAIVRGLLTAPERATLRERCVGRPGCGTLRALLDDTDRPTTVTRSELEELFLALIRQAGLAAPQVNILDGGAVRDFRWPVERVLVEVDGWAFHRGRRAFEQDRRRDARATAAGWCTLRFTYRQLIDERIAVVAQLAQALALGRGSAAAQYG